MVDLIKDAPLLVNNFQFILALGGIAFALYTLFTRARSGEDELESNESIMRRIDEDNNIMQDTGTTNAGNNYSIPHHCFFVYMKWHWTNCPTLLPLTIHFHTSEAC